jgi:hypothetical protein
VAIAVGAPFVGLFLESEDCQLAGGLQIAIAMLVKNRQRFDSKLAQRGPGRCSSHGATLGQFDDGAPYLSSLGIATLATVSQS